MKLPLLDKPIATITTDTKDTEGKRKHISFSQVSTYLHCGRKYKFRYVDGLFERPSMSLLVGSGGHTALELNAKNKIRTGDDLPLEAVRDLTSTFIDSEVRNAVDPIIDENDKFSKDHAISAVTVFRVEQAPSIIPAAAELEFNLDLNETEDHPEPIRIVNGKIDLITTDRAVEDDKFTTKMKNQLEVDLSPQLTLYAKVYHTITGLYPSDLRFRVFTPGSTRTPANARVIARSKDLMTPEAIERRFTRLTEQFRHVERGINNEVFPAADDPRVCSWCGYLERCQSALVTPHQAASIRATTTPPPEG